MLGGGLCNEVLTYVEDWIPQKNHGKEYGFQKELHEHLDTYLNEQNSGEMQLGLGGGTGGKVPVRRERGRSNADVVVDDQVGIEMKRDLTNSQLNTLRGQIQKYKQEFPCVIVVACGISDLGGWREVQNENSGMGAMGMQQSEVYFVHKKQEHFGKDPSDVRRDSGGWFDDGGGLF